MDELQKRIVIEGLGIDDYLGNNFRMRGRWKDIPDHIRSPFNSEGVKNPDSTHEPREKVERYEEALGIKITRKYKRISKQFIFL